MVRVTGTAGGVEGRVRLLGRSTFLRQVYGRSMRGGPAVAIAQ